MVESSGSSTVLRTPTSWYPSPLGIPDNMHTSPNDYNTTYPKFDNIAFDSLHSLANVVGSPVEWNSHADSLGHPSETQLASPSGLPNNSHEERRKSREVRYKTIHNRTRSDTRRRQAHSNSISSPNESTSYSLEPLATSSDVSGVLPSYYSVVEPDIQLLLSRLIDDNFDFISLRITTWINSRTLSERVLQWFHEINIVIIERAIIDTQWSEIYARLCRKIADDISSPTQNNEVVGREETRPRWKTLFCDYLQSRCMEEIERLWDASDMVSAESRLEDLGRGLRLGKRRASTQLSDKDRGARLAKRHVHNLVKFIGELFKRGLLANEIVHNCVKKFLKDTFPEDSDISCLCELLTNVGPILDRPAAKDVMESYIHQINLLISIERTSAWACAKLRVCYTSA